MQGDKEQVRYPHLHLVEWPFRVVPDESMYSFMADRARLVSDIKDLLRNLSRHPDSTMHLMWAWFGAGKTHTLRHIGHLCRIQFTEVVPIYLEFPKSTRNFLDVYRAFISATSIESIRDAYEEVFSSPKTEKFQKEFQFDFPDLFVALRLLYQGSADQQVAVSRWLRTELREKQVLKDIGVTRPIQSSEDALKAMSWLIRIMCEGEASFIRKRVLCMVDEYQRIEKLRRPAIEEINGCLHSIFNKCPKGLSIIISFSGFPEERRLPLWLSPEIKDRIGVEKPLLLPRLLSEEVFSFVRDVLGHFREPLANIPDEYFPFTKDAIERVIEIMEDKAKKAKREDQPKPRTIIQFLNIILREAEPLIEQKKIEAITPGFVDTVLEDVIILKEE